MIIDYVDMKYLLFSECAGKNTIYSLFDYIVRSKAVDIDFIPPFDNDIDEWSQIEEMYNEKLDSIAVDVDENFNEFYIKVKLKWPMIKDDDIFCCVVLSALSAHEVSDVRDNHLKLFKTMMSSEFAKQFKGLKAYSFLDSYSKCMDCISMNTLDGVKMKHYTIKQDVDAV